MKKTTGLSKYKKRPTQYNSKFTLSSFEALMKRHKISRYQLLVEMEIDPLKNSTLWGEKLKGYRKLEMTELQEAIWAFERLIKRKLDDNEIKFIVSHVIVQ